jgi:hypothetical protein
MRAGDERVKEATTKVGLHHGRMISGSKSRYRRDYPDHVVAFNAALADADGEELWWGDLDLTVDEPKLLALAAELETTIHVIYESDARYVGRKRPRRLDLTPAVVRLTSAGETLLGELRFGAPLTRNAAGHLVSGTREARERVDETPPRNLPDLMAYAEANGWTLVDDPASLPPSEWRGGPSGLPVGRLIFVKGEQAVGYEWTIATSRYDAGRRLLRSLRKWDAPDP